MTILSGGAFAPNFQRFFRCETVRRIRIRVGDARMVWASYITMLSLVSLGLRKPPGDEKVRCFLICPLRF